MAKTQTQSSSTVASDLVSEARALRFCAGLSPSEQRGLALCIDRKIVEAGYASGLRAGNPAWRAARRRVVTDTLRREHDLAVLREEIEGGVREAMNGDDAPTRDAAKAALRRVDAYEEFLREEARENVQSGYFEDDDAVEEESA